MGPREGGTKIFNDKYIFFWLGKCKWAPPPFRFDVLKGRLNDEMMKWQSLYLVMEHGMKLRLISANYTTNAAGAVGD